MKHIRAFVKSSLQLDSLTEGTSVVRALVKRWSAPSVEMQ